MMPQKNTQTFNDRERNLRSRVVLLLLLIMHFLPAALFTGCATTTANKEAADIHYRLGVVHLNEGNIPEALKELTNAVEKYPEQAEFHNALGLAYLAKGMHDDAIKHMKEALVIDPKFSDANTNLSAVYIEKREWDLAIMETKKALSNVFYATPERAYFNMGSALYEKADYQRAEESFKKAIASNPRYIIAYNHLGLTYMRMNKDKEAIEIFKAAIKNMPNNIDAHYNIGLIYLKTKDKEGAFSAFQEVIRLAPDSEMGKSARDYINLLK